MRIFKIVFQIMLLVSFIYGVNSQANTDESADKSSAQKSILVTGASTGIGRHLAETLAQNGHHVYAGARKEKDLAALNAIDNITAVRLDVTQQNEIDAAVKFVKQQGRGLYALVNNAGVFIGGEVVTTDIADHRMLFDINVEGVYRVTKAFMPLIIESRGRISTTGSIAGTVTNAQMSGYSGSKHWIEAFTDSLAAEMAPHKVKVSVIEPGNYQTNIRRSSIKRAHNKIKAEGGVITPEMQKAAADMAAYETSLKKPDEVSAAYMHALFDAIPLKRYVVTPNKNEHAFTISQKINQLVELNQWGEYSYSRDELVKLLDDALADKHH